MTFKFKFFISLVISLTFSQLSHGQYFAEANYGLNGSVFPTTNNASHAGVGFGFMDSNTALGAKLDFGLDQFRSTQTTKETGSDLYRFSLQALCNLTNLINERSYYDKINVLIHSGMGYTLGRSISTKAKINDHMVNVIMGITPIYKLTKNMDLTLDASLIFNVAQSYRFDVDYSATNNQSPSFTQTTYNAGIGVRYFLRK